MEWLTSVRKMAKTEQQAKRCLIGAGHFCGQWYDFWNSGGTIRCPGGPVRRPPSEQLGSAERKRRRIR